MRHSSILDCYPDAVSHLYQERYIWRKRNLESHQLTKVVVSYFGFCKRVAFLMPDAAFWDEHRHAVVDTCPASRTNTCTWLSGFFALAGVATVCQHIKGAKS